MSAPAADKPADSDAGAGARAESLSLGAAPPPADAAGADADSAPRARAPTMDEAYTREKAAEAGYDSHGGPSTALPVGMGDHLGAAPARNTASSGTVSGDAWDRDVITGASERETEAGIARGRAGGGGGSSSGAALPVGSARDREQQQQQVNLSGL